MRLLVTGGAGFIGANFVHATVREHPEVEVTVLDALTYAGSRESLAPVADDIRLVQGDVTDAELVEQAGRRVRRGRALRRRDARRQFAGRSRAVRAHQRRSARSRCWRPCAGTAFGCTTCPPTRCTATCRWMIPSGSPRRRRTTRRARTRRPRRRPTCWCGPGCGPTACGRRSPTAPTTTGRTSTWRSSSRARSPTC